MSSNVIPPGSGARPCVSPSPERRRDRLTASGEMQLPATTAWPLPLTAKSCRCSARTTWLIFWQAPACSVRSRQSSAISHTCTQRPSGRDQLRSGTGKFQFQCPLCCRRTAVSQSRPASHACNCMLQHPTGANMCRGSRYVWPCHPKSHQNTEIMGLNLGHTAPPGNAHWRAHGYLSNSYITRASIQSRLLQHHELNGSRQRPSVTQGMMTPRGSAESAALVRTSGASQGSLSAAIAASGLHPLGMLA